MQVWNQKIPFWNGNNRVPHSEIKECQSEIRGANRTGSAIRNLRAPIRIQGGANLKECLTNQDFRLLALMVPIWMSRLLTWNQGAILESGIKLSFWNQESRCHSGIRNQEATLESGIKMPFWNQESNCQFGIRNQGANLESGIKMPFWNQLPIILVNFHYLFVY